MVNMIEAMEVTQRAILTWTPGQGWRCTNAEGASHDQVTPCAWPWLAVEAMTGHCIRILENDYYFAISVQAGKDPWRCEWWPDSPQAKHLRSAIDTHYMGWVHPIQVPLPK